MYRNKPGRMYREAKNALVSGTGTVFLWVYTSVTDGKAKIICKWLHMIYPVFNLLCIL